MNFGISENIRFSQEGDICVLQKALVKDGKAYDVLFTASNQALLKDKINQSFIRTLIAQTYSNILKEFSTDLDPTRFTLVYSQTDFLKEEVLVSESANLRPDLHNNNQDKGKLASTILDTHRVALRTLANHFISKDSSEDSSNPEPTNTSSADDADNTSEYSDISIELESDDEDDGQVVDSPAAVDLESRKPEWDTKLKALGVNLFERGEIGDENQDVFWSLFSEIGHLAEGFRDCGKQPSVPEIIEYRLGILSPSLKQNEKEAISLKIQQEIDRVPSYMKELASNPDLAFDESVSIIYFKLLLELIHEAASRYGKYKRYYQLYKLEQSVEEALKFSNLKVDEAENLKNMIVGIIQKATDRIVLDPLDSKEHKNTRRDVILDVAVKAISEWKDVALPENYVNNLKKLALDPGLASDTNELIVYAELMADLVFEVSVYWNNAKKLKQPLSLEAAADHVLAIPELRGMKKDKLKEAILKMIREQLKEQGVTE